MIPATSACTLLEPSFLELNFTLMTWREHDPRHVSEAALHPGPAPSGAAEPSAGGNAQPALIVIGRHCITECVQLAGTLQRRRVHARYGYIIVLWLRVLCVYGARGKL